MATPAQNLLAKLHPPNKPKLSTTLDKKLGRISADKVLSEFGDHLKWLATRHLGKRYSDEYLIDGCFRKTQALKNNNEVTA